MPKEFWIYKGESNFCDTLVYNVDNDRDEKARPDGFYDIVALQDTVEGGLHVIEYSAYESLKKELDCLWSVLSEYKMAAQDGKFAMEPECFVQYMVALGMKADRENQK